MIDKLIQELRIGNFTITGTAIRLQRDAADALESQQRQIAELTAERDRLAALVYVPGMLRCAKCKFVQISTILDVGSGRMAANNEPDQCPNGCGPLWRVTERDAGNEMVDRCDTQTDRAQKAEAERDRLAAALTRIAAWEDGDVVGAQFDEPASAKIARDALGSIEPLERPIRDLVARFSAAEMSEAELRAEIAAVEAEFVASREVECGGSPGEAEYERLCELRAALSAKSQGDGDHG